MKIIQKIQELTANPSTNYEIISSLYDQLNILIKEFVDTAIIYAKVRKYKYQYFYI